MSSSHSQGLQAMEGAVTQSLSSVEGPSAPRSVQVSHTSANSLSHIACTLGIGMLCALLNLTPLHADDASSRFLWEQANARMATAHTPDDFLEAARTYNQLISAGIYNGPLFFNLGTALLLASDGENAVAALRRAERYLGSTPEIRVNLRQALALQSGQPDADLPWDHAVFFWHYDEPLRVRATVALCGWLLFWLALLLRQFMRPCEPLHPLQESWRGRIRTFSSSCLFCGLLLLFIFTSSAACSWLQEQMDNRTWGERVFVSKPGSEPTP